MFKFRRIFIGSAVFLCLNCGGGVAAPAGGESLAAQQATGQTSYTSQAGLFQGVLYASPDDSARPGNICLSSLKLAFDRGVNTATLLGAVTLHTPGKHPLPFALTAHDPAFSTFTFGPPEQAHCAQEPGSFIAISAEVFSTSGLKLSQPVMLPIRIATLSQRLEPPSTLTWVDSATYRDTTKDAQRPHVSAVDLNRAFAVTDQWLATERQQPFYQQRGMVQLPMADLILKPFTPNATRRQYGAIDTLYVVRRAAKFASALFPDLKEILVADLSDAQGATPATTLGQEIILLHPAGSHVAGRDVDVTYVSGSAGGYDLEKSFWFLYSVLESTAVDMVITAYKPQFIAMAREAARRGLISKIAAGRFNALSEDHELNHDRHMHIAVDNTANGNRSRRFTPADDAYRCYLAMKPEVQGGIFNFCAD